MARNKMVDGILMSLTAEEEAQCDKDTKAWTAGETARNAQAEIHRLEGQITSRRLREAYADATWMNAQEALIATERAKL